MADSLYSLIFGTQRPDLSYNDKSIIEGIARYMSSGRDLAQRQFYNSTRAGLLNPSTPPDTAGRLGGLSPSLRDQRQSDMDEAQNISYMIRNKLFGQDQQ